MKIHTVSFKITLFSNDFTHVGTRQRVPSPTTSAPLLAACMAQRFIDEQKIFQCALFYLFSLEINWNFHQTAFFQLWAKAILLLNDEQKKFSMYFFFVYLFWKWTETSNNLQFFIFGRKQCFYLTHSVL